MERVLGIGGIYFHASDPQGLAHWYEDCLGVAMQRRVCKLRGAAARRHTDLVVCVWVS